MNAFCSAGSEGTRIRGDRVRPSPKVLGASGNEAKPDSLMHCALRWNAMIQAVRWSSGSNGAGLLFVGAATSPASQASRASWRVMSCSESGTAPSSSVERVAATGRDSGRDTNSAPYRKAPANVSATRSTMRVTRDLPICALIRSSNFLEMSRLRNGRVRPTHATDIGATCTVVGTQEVPTRRRHNSAHRQAASANDVRCAITRRASVVVHDLSGPRTAHAIDSVIIGPELRTDRAAGLGVLTVHYASTRPTPGRRARHVVSVHPGPVRLVPSVRRSSTNAQEAYRNDENSHHAYRFRSAHGVERTVPYR